MFIAPASLPPPHRHFPPLACLWLMVAFQWNFTSPYIPIFTYPSFLIATFRA